jgi:hypothetical protein
VSGDLEHRQGEPARWSAEDIQRTVTQAQGKGQLALLVTDARGVVIAGIRATGGLTQLQYRPQDGTWEFHGAFSGPEVLEGSYVLRNAMGTDPEPPDDYDQDRAPVPEPGQLNPSGVLRAIPDRQEDAR